MIRIVIERKDGHIGFSTQYSGIDESEKIYHERCGNIATLRRCLNRLLDEIHDSDLERRLVDRLRRDAADTSKCDSVREFARVELAKWEK